MREFRMFQADAFSSSVFAGNPAAVLVLPDWLPDPEMQAIAAENNLAETAFVVPNTSGYAIRWFTPVQEVAFCGHATLASAHILAQEYHASGPIRFSTRKVGTLTVTPAGDGAYGMDLPALPPPRSAPFRISSSRCSPTDGWTPAGISRTCLSNFRRPKPF